MVPWTETDSGKLLKQFTSCRGSGQRKWLVLFKVYYAENSIQNYDTYIQKYVKRSFAGAKNVEEYWEMLAGYSDAYEKIRNEWSNINKLHKKILKFIGTNLSKKYGITVNETLPVHLLGKMIIVYKLNSPLIQSLRVYGILPLKNTKIIFEKSMKNEL